MLKEKYRSEKVKRLERDLRHSWTRHAVSEARQDAVLARIAEQAKAGAQMGPWTIGGE